MSQTLTKPAVPAVQYLAMVAASVGLLTLSAKVTIPFWPVPMTLQVAAVLLIASVGGARFAAASLGSYLMAGAVGLPVFAGTPEKGIGLAYMVGTTGGYLLGFFIAAVLVGWVADTFGKFAAAIAMPVGLAVIYGFGLAWLAQFVPGDKVLAYGLTPFIAGDLVKVALAAVLSIAAPAGLRRLIKG